MTPNPCAPVQVGQDGGYLSFGVAIAILVLIPECKLLWEALLDLLIGHLLADPLREWGCCGVGKGAFWGVSPPKEGGVLTASISLRAFHCS